MTALADLFLDGAYRHHLSASRGEPGLFFRTQDGTGRILAERAHWLATYPDRHAALLPDGAALLDEFFALTAAWGCPVRRASGATESADDGARTAAIQELGAAFEPDILLLSPDAEGRFRLRGGAVCFPTAWALEEKLGHTLDFIHMVVPSLNAVLGSPIHQFLSRLKPGPAFLRDNWGLAASEEFNLHPSRNIAAPTLPVTLDRLWLRVEYQALVALPRTRGIAFGIRLALHRLDRVARDPAAPGLRRALETMPPEVAAYKRLDRIRSELIRLL